MTNKLTQSNPTQFEKPLIRSAYSPRCRVSITFPADSPYTKQEFKEESDINTIMRKYQFTGEIPVMNERDPQYLDATGLDFQNHMNFVAGAQTLFNELPSTLRNRFDNDPALFLDFTSDPKNREEMLELGLLKPPTEWVNPPVAPVAPVVTAPIVTE